MTDIGSPAHSPLHRSALAAREFVHRLAPSQVLLTEVRPTGPDEFRVVARWPRAEAAEGRGAFAGHEPLMVAETLRQLGVYLPLRFYGVHADYRLLIEELRLSLEPDDASPDRSSGTEIVCTVHADRIGRPGAAKSTSSASAQSAPRAVDAARAEPPRNFGLRVTLAARGRDFARADGIARILSPVAYRAVRNYWRSKPAAAQLPMTAVDPERVGVRRTEDVLVALDSDGAVRIAPADAHHPFYHDHPSDHVTGMILVGAVHQAAALQTNEPNLRLRSCSLRALRFTEPAPAATVEIGPAGRFDIRQRGTVTATGEALFES